MNPAGQAKQAVRERVWSLLERAGAVEPGVAGHIPDFRGADQAAGRLAALPVWECARVIEVVPDRAQFPVRRNALEAGKPVYMAVPGLAGTEPFYRLAPHGLTVEPAMAADRVCGSVAVNLLGARLGKGAGYSDIEFALLTEAGAVSDQTTILTTVHELQVLDEELPEQDHDFRVDLIVTPERVVRCGTPRRPAGLDWAGLGPEQIAAMPVLGRRSHG